MKDVKKLIRFLALIILILNCICQRIEWTNIIGTDGFKIVTGMDIDSNNNIYIIGETDENVEGQSISNSKDVLLIKLNQNGEKEWTKLIGSSEIDKASGVATDLNNDVYVFGISYGNIDGNINTKSRSFFLSKIDSTGLKKWTNLIESNSEDFSYGVETDINNNVYVIGQQSLDVTNDAFLKKFDSFGQEEWTRFIQTNGDDKAYSLATDSNYNIYLIGETTRYLDGNINFGAFLKKFDTRGEIEWTKILGYTNMDKVIGITIDLNNNIYVIGITYGTPGVTNNQGSKKDIFLSKYETRGQKIWTKIVGSNFDITITSITTDIYGKIYVTGHTKINLDGNYNAGLFDVLLIKYDSNGQKIWTKLMGSNYDDNAVGIRTDSIGNVFITGYIQVLNQYDSFLTKIKICSNNICDPSQIPSVCISNEDCKENELCFSEKCLHTYNSIIPIFKPPETVLINSSVKIFDISNLHNKEIIQFMTRLDTVILYPADLFNTGSLTLSPSIEQRVITINILLFVFNKSPLPPNETSVDIKLYINGIEQSFEKNYDIINYPKSELIFNSDEINYSILSLNHVHVHSEKIDTSILEISNTDVNKYKVFAKLIHVYSSSCNPKCRRCDKISFDCIGCFNLNSNPNNNCECTKEKPQLFILNNYSHVGCYENYESDNCDQYELMTNGFSKCLDCKQQFYKTFDEFVNPICKCNPGESIFTSTNTYGLSGDCFNYLEIYCLNNYSLDLNVKIINEWVSTNNNLSIKISKDIEYIFNEEYFRISISNKALPYDNIAFKLSIQKGVNEVSNVLFSNYWINSLSEGIIINKQDIQKGLYDCETISISNGAKIHECNIKVYIFNPCNSYIYLNTISKIKIGDGGVIESSILIDASRQNNIDIPCLNKNTCFFNEKFSNTIIICDKLPCLQSRTIPFAPGDLMNIKPKLSVSDGNSDKYSQSIETALFLIKNNNGDITGKFDVTNDFKLTLENGKKIFGFTIPVAESLMSRSGYLEGANISFDVIFRVDESLRRILISDFQNSYSLIRPVNIKIEIDPEYLIDGNKFKDLNSDDKFYTLVIIFSCITTLIIFGVLIYCYFNKRKYDKIKIQKNINNIKIDKELYSSNNQNNKIEITEEMKT